MNELIELNKEQLKAVKHGQGPLLIIAGAGTGKTTVVTQRIKHLILEKQIDPSSILALTFTEKAALEMESRVDVVLPYGYTQLWISTFHSFCDRILRDEAIHIGLNPSYKLSTEAEAMLLLKKNIFKLKLDYFRPLGSPYKFLQGLIQHFNRLKDDDITTKDYKKFAEKFAKDKTQEKNEVKKIFELANTYAIYEEIKSQEGIMDFSDLNANVLRLFRERPNILKYYQEKFKYTLVDEFQDTNFAQNTLAMLIAGDKKNINVVGDDDQSIYRWRGAAIANIIQFRKNFPQATIVTLIKNYRSSKEILDSAYQLIQHNNPDRLEFKEKIDKRLIAMKNDQEMLNPSISASNLVQTDGIVEFLYTNNIENEAEQVKKSIKKLVNEKGLLYKDIAILVRANDHSQPFVRCLERSKIPYQFLGPGHLFHQEEIKDLVSYLKVLSNFQDNSAMYRLLSMPVFDLDARDIAAIINYAKIQNLSLFEAIEKVEQIYIKDVTKEKVKRITLMINKHLKRIPRDTAGQILYYFLEDSGLLQNYLAASLPQDEKRAQNVAKFFEKLKEFESSHIDSSVFATSEWIELAMQLGESPKAADMDWADTNAVNILTIHSSKGLEFKAVFLVNLVTQRFPTRARKEQIPVSIELIKEILPVGDYNLQEERRLFYVGMTRAKLFLYLCASQYYSEGKTIRKISPFVYEAIGEEIVKKLLNKEKDTQSIKQLSLLDLANDQVQQELTNGKESMDSTSNEQQPTTHTPIPITYISYSQIQSFDICPLHYKLKNILKIPTPPSSAQNIGISIHNTLKDYFNLKMADEDVDKLSIDSLLRRNWLTTGFESKEHMNQAFINAQASLTRFLNNETNKKANPLALETAFGFFIKKLDGSSLKVGGRIDRIDSLNNEKIEIIDYKTGHKIPDQKKLDVDLQLSIYALAASEVQSEIFHRNPENVILSLWYVDQDIKVSTVRTRSQLDVIKQQITEKVAEISTSKFICSGGIICQNCEFKMVCQTHSIQH